MISFGRVMTNGSTEIFQISACAALFSAFLGVGATCLAVDVAEHFCAPPLVQSLDPFLELADSGDGIFTFAVDSETMAKLVQLYIQINRESVRDRDIVYVAHSPLRYVFRRYVVFQLSFRDRNLICSAACADIPAVVSDDPGCSVGDFSARVSAGGLKLKSGPLASSRHSSRIRSM